MKKFSRKIKKGFTLVELVVVIAIIAILSAASVATYFGVTTSARKTTGKSEAQQIMDVIRVAALDESDDRVSAKQDANGYYLYLNVTGEKDDVALIKDILSDNGITFTSDRKNSLAEPTGESSSDKIVKSLDYSTQYYSYKINFANFTVELIDKIN